MDFDNDTGYSDLKALLEKIDKERGTEGNRLFYLAVAPEYFSDIINRLGDHGMAHPEKGHARVIIEKPFGHDLESARELNDEVNKVFHEEQIFRIDHYLGKETVQNILVFRFANGIFEPIWNRNFIDHVQITASESIGIEGRGPFYEKAGALRDVVQNHVMELLSFVAMEPPVSFEANSVRGEKVKVWRAIKPIPIEKHGARPVCAGHGGRTAGAGLPRRGSRRSEFNHRDLCRGETGDGELALAGVPFYLRAGKRMAKRVTEITIQFKQPPLLLFDRLGSGPCNEIQPNLLKMSNSAR